MSYWLQATQRVGTAVAPRHRPGHLNFDSPGVTRLAEYSGCGGIEASICVHVQFRSPHGLMALSLSENTSFEVDGLESSQFSGGVKVHWPRAL